MKSFWWKLLAMFSGAGLPSAGGPDKAKCAGAVQAGNRGPHFSWRTLSEEVDCVHSRGLWWSCLSSGRTRKELTLLCHPQPALCRNVPPQNLDSAVNASTVLFVILHISLELLDTFYNLSTNILQLKKHSTYWQWPKGHTVDKLHQQLLQALWLMNVCQWTWSSPLVFGFFFF